MAKAKITITGSGKSDAYTPYAFLYINNTVYTSAQVVEVELGTVCQCRVGRGTTGVVAILLDGNPVKEVTDTYGEAIYELTVNRNYTIELGVATGATINITTGAEVASDDIHNSLISGTAHEIESGTVLIGGVLREIESGLTLVGGVQRDIKFSSLEPGMLGLFSNGDTVYIPENGVLAPFYVAKHNYESGLNGNGRTLLVRKDCFAQCVWGSSANCYDATDIDAELNTTYLNMLSNDVKTLIGTTGFYIRASTGSLDTKAIYRAVFSLSNDEYGFTTYNSQVAKEGSALAIASAIRIANYNGNAVQHFTRTMRYSGGSVNVIYASTSGTAGSTNTVLKRYYRPVFTMPDTTLFNEYTGELDV